MASSLDSTLASTSGEQPGANEISKIFVQESSFDSSNIPVSVFDVPESIKSVKPEAYVPLTIALGPYHHLEPQLYQMERYKVATVRAFLSPNQVLNFQNLVINRLKQLEQTIRACYHKFLDQDADTLAWIIAIDGLFLLDILSNFSDKKDLNSPGRKLKQSAIICRDIMVLENQIPVILLKELRKTLQLSSPDDTDDTDLLSMLENFCQEHSPLKLAQKVQTQPDSSPMHLLDLLYQLIVNTQKEDNSELSPEKEAAPKEEVTEVEMKQDFLVNVGEIVDKGQKLGIGEVVKPFQILQRVPWEKVSNLLGIVTKNVISPLVKEITTPSASNLSKVSGVTFSPTNEGIGDIRFIEEEATLYLPVITLNSNTEVVLRNLVAYEAASSESSTAQLAQYVNLMTGIINSGKDAKFLSEKGIIKGGLSDDKVADLFSGMRQSPGNEGYSKTTEKINAYFDKRPSVKAYKFVQKRIYDSWRVLTLLSTIVLMLLVILQSFCDVYGCTDRFGLN